MLNARCFPSQYPQPIADRGTDAILGGRFQTTTSPHTQKTAPTHFSALDRASLTPFSARSFRLALFGSLFSARLFRLAFFASPFRPFAPLLRINRTAFALQSSCDLRSHRSRVTTVQFDRQTDDYGHCPPCRPGSVRSRHDH